MRTCDSRDRSSPLPSPSKSRVGNPDPRTFPFCLKGHPVQQSNRVPIRWLPSGSASLPRPRANSPSCANALFGRKNATSPRSEEPGSRESLLILGGTSFLGPRIVEAALAEGWTVTLFNRGRTNPILFPELETLHGDRNGDLKSLAGRRWDCVVDPSGYLPRLVRDSATVLKDAVKQYIFISTISVYADTSRPGMDETTPVGRLEDESVEQVTGEAYGPLKALCEKAADAVLPGRVTVIRPGLIVGPGDPTDRFTYWPARLSRGGEVLAPGSPGDPVQVIDVRDLSEWVVRTARDGTTGAFNAVSSPFGMGHLLEVCKAASGSDAMFTWADVSFLADQKVEPWSDMPAWVPPTGDTAGLGRVSNARATAKGLTFRPIEATVRDTFAWWKALPDDRRNALRAGLSPEREAVVLRTWHARPGRPGP